jgi:hypothetical protein
MNAALKSGGGKINTFYGNYGGEIREGEAIRRMILGTRTQLFRRMSASIGL